jgi:hypothetical protein
VRHFDLEQGRNATLRRFQRLALGAEVNPRDLADRLEVSIFPSVFLNDHDAIDAYSRECEGVDLALIDALRGATPGVDENDSKIRACLDNLTHVSERTGTAFVLIHHSGKPREGHADNRTIPRGSSAIFDAAGCVFVVVGESEGPRHVSQQKTPAEAEGGRIADFYVEVEDVARDGRPTAGVRVVVRTPEQVQPPRKQGAQFEALRSKVVDLVRTESNLTSRNAICNRIVGGSKSAKLDAIAELMDERRLVQPGGDGSPFRLSS